MVRLRSRFGRTRGDYLLAKILVYKKKVKVGEIGEIKISMANYSVSNYIITGCDGLSCKVTDHIPFAPGSNPTQVKNFLRSIYHYFRILMSSWCEGLVTRL